MFTYEHCAFQERWELKYNQIIRLIRTGIVNVTKLYNINTVVVINQNMTNVISRDKSKETTAAVYQNITRMRKCEQATCIARVDGRTLKTVRRS